MSLEAISDVLAAVPAAGAATPSIAERAAEAPEAGRGNGPAGNEAASGWGSVLKAQNEPFTKLEEAAATKH